jgi:hypothetical protein
MDHLPPVAREQRARLDPPPRRHLSATPIPSLPVAVPPRPEETIMSNAAMDISESRASSLFETVRMQPDTYDEHPPYPDDLGHGAAAWGQRLGRARKTALALGMLAVIEAAAMGWMLTGRTPAAAAAAPIVIDSPERGSVVLVNDREAGITPFEVKVGSDVRSIRVVNRSGSAQTAAAVAAVAEQPVEPALKTDPKTAQAIAQAAARQRSGGLRLSSPIELKVFEGERVLGSSADGPIVATAGAHELELVNAALGFRSHQRITIKAGQIVSLAVSPPDGRLSINASPWAQVLIDGKAAGETPLANVAAPVGEHEITFRHPQLGEKRETVLVKSGALTRVSATLGR